MVRDIVVTTCPYEGFEEEIRHLRNRNRQEDKSRAYFDWRYLGQKTPPAIIFKIMDAGQKSIGMLGIIFRTYLLDGEQQHCAVIGDFSIDAEHRDKGLATELVRQVNAFLLKEEIPCAFVIPTPAAQKVFTGCGWRTTALLIPYVLVIDAEKKIFTLTNNRLLSKIFGRLSSLTITALVNLFYSKEIIIIQSESFDASFDKLFAKINKRNIVTQEKSCSTMEWRYSSYPDTGKFDIHTLYRKHEVIGYIISATSPADQTCTVYDLLFINKVMARTAMAAFVKTALQQKKWQSIRVVLSDSHPYRAGLRLLGFMPRTRDALAFQTFSTCPCPLNRYQWMLTSGDKDV